jgi:hypothetical protein
MPDD